MFAVGAVAAAAAPVLGYWVANNPKFHVGKSGFGSCTTADDVVNQMGGEAALKGKVCLITGANSGIGKETARSLAKAGVHLLLPCRTLAKAKELADEFKQYTGKITPLELDLSDLDSCRKCVNDIKALELPLSTIICNAGVMAIPTRTGTKQGFETQMGVCHLAHFLLVTELLPILEKSAPSRVVMVSSTGHRMCKDAEVFKSPKLEGSEYGPWANYGNAKMANILFATELNDRYASKGITAYSLHPGGIHTNLQVHVNMGVAIFWAIVTPFFFKSTQQGASTSVFCAIHPNAESHAGNYFEDCNVSKPYMPQAGWMTDKPLRAAFWNNSQAAVQSK